MCVIDFEYWKYIASCTSNRNRYRQTFMESTWVFQVTKKFHDENLSVLKQEAALLSIKQNPVKDRYLFLFGSRLAANERAISK